MQSSAENHQHSILFCVRCALYTLALIDLVHTNDLLAPAPTGSGMQQLSGSRHRVPNQAARWTMMQECSRVRMC